MASGKVLSNNLFYLRRNNRREKEKESKEDARKGEPTRKKEELRAV